MAETPLPPDLWTRLCELLAEARQGRYDGGRIVLEIDPTGQVSAMISEWRVKHRRGGEAATFRARIAPDT